MANNWTITENALTGAVTFGITTGANALLSSTAVYLEMDDTNVGGINFRLYNISDQFNIQWNVMGNSNPWTSLLTFTNPQGATPYAQLVAIGLQLTNLPVGPNQVYQQFVGAEANPRFEWDTNGLISWGPGGASAVDTVLQRTAAAVLQVTGNMRGTAAPSNIADLTRKDYVDTQIATRLALSGGTISGTLTVSGATTFGSTVALNADPTTNLQAATKQYVDNHAGAGLTAPALTAGSVIFATGAAALGQDNANLFWDRTNHRLGLGNNTPATLLDIANSTITLRQAGGNYSLTWANPAAARAISIPDPGGTDVFVFAAMTQALTGKTYNGLTVSTTTGTFTLTNGKTFAVQAGLTLTGTDGTTITFQGTDTYVGRATVDTLTNKTLSQAVETNPAYTTQTLAGAASQTINCNSGTQVIINLNQNVTLNAPTNATTGNILYIKFLHDGTANVYTITWNAVFKRAGGAYANTNTANAVDTITFMYDGTNWNEIGRAINLS